MTVAAEACPMMPWASMTGHSVATMLCRDDMPAHYRCLAGRYGGAWGKGGDGWMDSGRHFGPKLLDEQPRGADDQLVFGPLSSTTSCLSLGRYGH